MPEGLHQNAGADPCLADLGEWGLIERLSRFAPPDQFLDDAALIHGAHRCADPALVVNTDVLVADVHFSDRTTGPEDVGWRATMANLSDLAAMGCTSALGLTVGLVAPPTTAWSWVEGVYEGLHQALTSSGGTLLGGDCSSGPTRMLAITALGLLPEQGGGPIHRCDGRPGDWLVASGAHGLSRLGLALLRQEPVQGLDRLDPNQQQALAARAIAAHRRPRARFDAVVALEQCRPAALPWRVAGTDSSDGLLPAVASITRASRCGARLERLRLPMDPAMADFDVGRDWCLGGGEDFELVLALEPAWAEALLARLAGSHLIGTLTPANAASATLIWAEDGAPIECSDGGYSHFQNPTITADD